MSRLVQRNLFGLESVVIRTTETLPQFLVSQGIEQIGILKKKGDCEGIHSIYSITGYHRVDPS